MRAFNIKWDLSEDIEMYGEKDCTCLPNEVVIPNKIWDEQICDVDDVADWLSDEYGFCVESFELDDKEECEIRCPYCNGDFVAPYKNGLYRCMECGNEFNQ